MLKILQKARPTALRHLPHTHRIDLQWLFGVCSNPHVCMRYVGTLQQVADLMSKALNKPETWFHLFEIAQIRGGLTSEAKAGKPQIVGKALAIQSDSCDVCNVILCSNSVPAAGEAFRRQQNVVSFLYLSPMFAFSLALCFLQFRRCSASSLPSLLAAVIFGKPLLRRSD